HRAALIVAKSRTAPLTHPSPTRRVPPLPEGRGKERRRASTRPSGERDRVRGHRTSHMKLNLLQLDQRAAEILGMEEQHGLVVGAELGLAVAQDARPFALELVAGGDDVLDLVADMVHAARRIALEEIAHRRVSAIGLQELD